MTANNLPLLAALDRPPVPPAALRLATRARLAGFRVGIGSWWALDGNSYVRVAGSKHGVEIGLEMFDVTWSSARTVTGRGRFHGWPERLHGVTVIEKELRRIVLPV